MNAEHALAELRAEMEAELTGGIIPFWLRETIDERRGGFVGLIGPDGAADADAPKGAILNTRILWTFSAAARALGDAACREAADRAAGFLRQHLTDPIHGGVFWMVDADGTPRDERKHVYAQSFAIYALAEHHRATGDDASLRDAVELFRLIEQHARDDANGGYQEAFSRAWVLLDDVRLSEVDAPERKSMNTHLHLLEAYTNLYRVWPDALLADRLRELVELFLATIVRPNAHLCGFFDDDWTPRSEVRSYGHDIEASWLMLEAAAVLGDGALRERVRESAVRIATAVLDEAFDEEHGGIFYEAKPGGEVVTEKEWWPQAEAIVGFLCAYEETGHADFLTAASATWRFTRDHIVDREGGEWHRCVSRAGDVRPGHEKVGPWKGPYHNGRACLEVLARVGRMAEATAASGD